MSLPTIDTVFGGNFQSANGSPIDLGTITFQLSQEAQVIGIDSQIVPNTVVSYPLNSSGSVVSSPLWGTDQLNPAGLYYIVNIYNNLGQLCAGPLNAIISGQSPIDLGNLVFSGVNPVYVTFSLADNYLNINTSETIPALQGNNLFITLESGTAGIALSLPSATGNTGLSIRFIKIDSSVGSAVISGGLAGTYTLTNIYQYVVFESDGTYWYVIGNN